MDDKPLKILLIEDSLKDAHRIAEMLTEARHVQFNLKHAERLSTGLACLAEGGIDLILLDLALPDSDGLDPLVKINAETSEVPIVLLSGMDDETRTLEAMKAGAQDFLVTGHFESDTLERVIRYAIERHRLVTERIRAEEALEKSEREYRNLVDNALVGIYKTNLNGDVLYANEAIANIFEFETPQEFISAGVAAKYKNPEDRTAFIEKLKQTGRIESMELETVTKTGATRQVLLSAVLDGEVLEGMIMDITEHKGVEKALRESEEKFRNLAEKSPNMIFINQGGSVVYVNEVCAQLMGYSREEFLSPDFDFMRLIAQESIGTVQENFRRHMQGQEVPPCEYQLLTKEGKRLDGIYTTRLITYEGQPAILGIVTDITERKQMEETLRESEKRYRALYEEAPIAYYAVGTNGHIHNANPHTAEMSGYALDDLIGRPVFDLYADTPAGKQKAEQMLLRFRAGEEIRGEELEWRTADGRSVWINLTVRPSRDAAGQVVESRAMAVDITERKRAEQTLGEERNLLRTLIDNLPDYIYVLDTESRFIISNIAVAHLMGAAHPDDLIGKTDFDFYPQKLAAQYRADDQIVIQSGQPQINQEEAVIGPSGSTNWVLTTRVPLQDSQGKIVGLVGISRDITERKQMEQTLQRSQQVLQLFVENTPAPIAMFDGEMRYIAVSRRYLIDYELGDQDLVGRSHYEIFPEISERWKEIHRRCLGGATERADEEPFPRANGKLDWVHWEIRPWYEDTREIGGIILFSEVITERKRAEEALRQSEERLRAFTNALPDLAFILDGDGRHVEVLTGQKGLLSVSAEQMKGRLLHEVLPKKEADELLAMVRHTIDTGQPQVLEYVVDLPAGQRWFEGRTSPLREISDKDSMVVLISRDVTEHKHAEEVAREAKQRYRNLFEEAPVMSVISRRQEGEPIVTDCNQLFLSTLGFSKAEVLGRRLADFYTSESRVKLQKGRGYQQSLEGRFIVEERELLTSHGQVVETLMYAFPETDGGVIGTRAMYVDISERKRADAELKQRATQLALINDIGSRIAAVLELDNLLDRAARLVQESFDYHHVALFMIDGEVLRLKAVASLYAPIPANHTQRLSQGINGWVATHGEEIVANDVSTEPRYTFLIAEHSITQSELCLPIKVAGHTVGVLDIQSPYPNTFDENDIIAMETLTGQIAVAIENARLHTETERRVQQLAVMHELDRAISASLHIDDVYRAFSEYTELLLSYDRMSIVLLEAGELIITYVAGIAEPGVGTKLPSKDSTSERVLTHSKPLLIHDVTADSYSTSDADWATGVKSVMVLPLQVKGQAIGTWNIFSRQVGFYDVDDLYIAQSIADQLAIGIENARLYEQAQQEILERKRRTLELSTMLETAKAVSSTLDLDKMLILIARQMMKAIGVTGCTLSRWDQEYDMLTTWIDLRREGPEYAEKPGTTYALNDYPMTRAVLETLQSKTVLATDPNTDRAEAALLQKQGTLSLLMLPLSIGERAIGLVELDDDQERIFTPADIRLSQALADQCAVAVENARLYRQAQQEISQRTQAEAALEEERASLAQRVEARTAELSVANAELARAAHLKDEFLANMSHELRTPLNAVLGMSEVLRNEVYGPLTSEQREALGHIEGGGRHLLELINDILDLSKIEAGKFDLNIGTVWVDDICQASLLFVKQMAQKKRIKVFSSFDNTVETLQADQRRLKQILVNLLSNAVKFTPDEGQVGLEVEGDATHQAVHFTVWDTGIGIAPEAMNKLFKPFVQIDSRLSRQYEGTGLGLSLVRRLTEMHGGGVSVDSEVGQGSRFTVSLPWQSERSGAVEQEGSGAEEISDLLPSTPAPGHPCTVLLVEDNETNIIMMRDILQAKGYRVIVARNGREAIERTRETGPDVILMDIQMPELDGLEATRRIRADDELAAIPIIALTALAMPGDRERCLAAGANEYLSKPVSLQQLIKAIETQRPRIEQQK